MKRTGVLILVLALALVAGQTAFGQSSMTSALRGQVLNQGAGLPGVAVEVKSPSLQGTRTTYTSANGDFVFAALPPGAYTVTFKLQGFETVTKKVSLSATQAATMEASMAIAGVTAAATVTATAETVSTTTQASTTINSELTNKLPISRSIVSQVDLSSGITRTGPAGAITISGANSSENVFTVDGAVIQDNVRSTPYNLFIEDAVQETTTSVSSVSAEFGRFTGGIVNTVTKSGGNSFSGSIRATLNNDAWQAASPFQETKIQKVNPTYEATLGGFFWKDHIWFFGSGRSAKTTASNLTGYTSIPFESGTDEKRWQGKLTLTPFQNHSITGNYLQVRTEQTGYVYPNAASVMDMASIVTRQLPQDIFTLTYNGVITSSFFLEGLYSSRHFTFENSGSTYTDLINGTLMRDKSRSNARYNSPTFCGVCSPEKRDNRDYLIKGTYFLSTESFGSHNIVAGYDNFAGQRKSNNYQSGSNYRVFTTSAILQGGDIFPVVDGKSWIYYTPIEFLSQGTDSRTDSIFINDQWRLGSRLSFNLGVRYDKNHAKDSRGVVTADDSAFSPRLAVAYDVKDNGALKVAASYARYVAGIQDNLVDSASNAGAPSTFYWYYTGPNINVSPPPGANLVTRAAALQQMFDYFFSQGCPNVGTCKMPLIYANIPGLTRQIRDTLKSPYANEYTLGVNGTIGGRASYRVDFVRRQYGDFYNTVVDMSTGRVSDTVGNTYDLGINNNTNALDRNYTALQTQFSYRFPGLTIGANWTWSHTLGNIDGENTTSGPIAATQDTYPEYKQASWNNPYGSLATDQRHRVRIFGSWDLPFVPKEIGIASLSLVQAYETGSPYGAVATVRSRTYVTNPGYVTPPSSVTYYYTARDAYHWDDVKRTDLGLNLSTKIANTVEIFVQPQVINLFNNQAVIAGDVTVRTALSPGTGNTFLPFNPFTETPVKRPTGDTSVKTANWDFGPAFGTPRNSADYQQPRTFILTMGIRF